MASKGKYVRAPVASDYEYSDEDHDTDTLSDPIADVDSQAEDCDCLSIPHDEDGASGGSTEQYNVISNSDQVSEPANISQTTDETRTPQCTSNGSRIMTSIPSSTDDRLQRVENVLADITKALDVLRAMPPARDTEQIWTNAAAQSCTSDSTSSHIRWDSIKSFPNGVAANKMWEEWNRGIESQLLFLSVGEELQGIIRAAKLRPNLTDANCYNVFVSNIKTYLQSMTDSAAEHEAFWNMRQEKSESAIAFHARLMGKVRLCEYSPSDQERFVRAQLLKGLRNKELVKAARTYAYDTKYIVQAATRDEAYQAESAVTESSEVFVVGRDLHNHGLKEKRPHRDVQQPRRDHLSDHDRRSRCPRCYQYPHRSYPCPALKRKCNSCPEFGHYAVVCRKSNIRQLRIANDESPKREVELDENQV